MSSEVLSVFDDKMNRIGQKTRDEIHETGDWHETFHCWLTTIENDECYVVLQKRAEIKKDYPGLFDITSAGHLLADEGVEEGVREVKEELGISVEFDDLIPLGIQKVEIKLDQIWDREICHVFLYECQSLPEFHLQKDEVDSLHKARLDDLLELFEGKVTEISLLEIGDDEHQQLVNTDSFVGKGSYYEKVFIGIKEKSRKS
ncbi:MAG TPA: NUDIX domain-containing protein [Bacillales bacterium]|nr:NUDIX domain-containing protein [Bacillales bacterium]